MTLRNSVIIRVCMGIQRSYKIFQTKGKKKKNRLTCPVVCITCGFMLFGGVLERFQWVLASLYSSHYKESALPCLSL